MEQETISREQFSRIEECMKKGLIFPANIASSAGLNIGAVRFALENIDEIRGHFKEWQNT